MKVIPRKVSGTIVASTNPITPIVLKDDTYAVTDDGRQIAVGVMVKFLRVYNGWADPIKQRGDPNSNTNFGAQLFYEVYKDALAEQKSGEFKESLHKTDPKPVPAGK